MPNSIPVFQNTQHLKHYLLADASLKQECGVVNITVAGTVYIVNFDQAFLSTMVSDGTEQFFRNLADEWSEDTATGHDGAIIAKLLLPISTGATFADPHPTPQQHRTFCPVGSRIEQAREYHQVDHRMTASCWRDAPAEFQSQLANCQLRALTQLSNVYSPKHKSTLANKFIFSQRVLELSEQEFAAASLNHLHQLIKPFTTKGCISSQLMRRIGDQVLAIMASKDHFDPDEITDLAFILKVMTELSFSHPCLSSIAQYFSHNLGVVGLNAASTLNIFRNIVTQHAMAKHRGEEDLSLTESLLKMYGQLSDLQQSWQWDPRFTDGPREIMHHIGLYGCHVLKLPTGITTCTSPPQQPLVRPVEQQFGDRLQQLLPDTVFEQKKLLPIFQCHADLFCPPNIVIQVENPTFQTVVELDDMRVEKLTPEDSLREVGTFFKYSRALLNKTIMESAGYIVLRVSDNPDQAAIQFTQMIQGQAQSQGAAGYTPPSPKFSTCKLQTATPIAEQVWQTTPGDFQARIASYDLSALTQLAYLYDFKQSYQLDNKRLFCKRILAQPEWEFQALPIRQLVQLIRPFLHQNCHSRHLLQRVGDQVMNLMREERNLTLADNIHLATIYKVMTQIPFEHPCLHRMAQHFADGFDPHPELNLTATLHLFRNVVNHHASLKHYNQPENRVLTGVLRTMYQQLDRRIGQAPLTMAQQTMVHWIKLYSHYMLGQPMIFEPLAPPATTCSLLQKRIERALRQRLTVPFECEKRLPDLQFDVDLYCEPNIVIEVEGPEYHTSIDLDLLQGGEKQPWQEQLRKQTSRPLSSTLLKNMIMEKAGYRVLTVSDRFSRTLTELVNSITTIRAKAGFHQTQEQAQTHTQAQAQAQYQFQSEQMHNPGWENAANATHQYQPVPVGWNGHQFLPPSLQIPPGMQLVLGEDGQHYLIPTAYWVGQEPQE